jgi:hypothetical protein
LLIQGELNQERMRTRTLRSHLTHMENEYHSAINRISRAPAPLECASSDDEGPVSMPCLPFSSAAHSRSGGPKQMDIVPAAAKAAQATVLSPSLVGAPQRPGAQAAVPGGVLSRSRSGRCTSEEHPSEVRISASAAATCAMGVPAAEGLQMPVSVPMSAS